jgi:imidazolonepropionase
MTATLFSSIGELVTCDPSLGDGSPLGILRDAAIVVEHGLVAWVGAGAGAPVTDEKADCAGACVVPGFVDSHTHLVFEGERSAEFAARMAGEPYTGGGIATTVAATRAASTERLREGARRRSREMISQGTTTIEAKSGYGLTVADERRLLEVAGEFTGETTFLGAHAVPPEYASDRGAYIDLVCGEMLAACAPLARWIDVFCDAGAFDEQETRRVLAAGVAAGLIPRLHGNQLAHGPGARIAAEARAASLDHCNYLTDEDVGLLRDAGVVATLLPGADFCTRSPYADARRLLDAGVTVAIATDCNPGTSYVTSMPFCIALAVREMRMTSAEAVWAATAGGAAALWRNDIGHLSPGASADFAVLDAPSFTHLAYRPGANVVERVFRGGEQVA